MSDETLVRKMAEELAGSPLPESGLMWEAYEGMAKALVEFTDESALMIPLVEEWLKSGRQEPGPGIRSLLANSAERHETLKIMLPRLEQLAKKG